jgi:hypothetical protein
LAAFSSKREMENKTETANAREYVDSKSLKGEIAFEHESGKIRGTVWKNFSQKTGKHYFKWTIRRIETDDGGTAHLANSFWSEDPKDVATVATAVRIWFQNNTDEVEQQRKWKGEQKKRPKKPASKAESNGSDPSVNE